MVITLGISRPDTGESPLEAASPQALQGKLGLGVFTVKLLLGLASLAAQALVLSRHYKQNVYEDRMDIS